jgi:hypothetical protein
MHPAHNQSANCCTFAAKSLFWQLGYLDREDADVDILGSYRDRFERI